MKKTVSLLVCLLLAGQALLPARAAARPAKLEISNGLGISLFLISSALFGTVVAFSPKSKRGEPAKPAEAEGKTAEKPVRSADEMKKELEEMRTTR